MNDEKQFKRLALEVKLRRWGMTVVITLIVGLICLVGGYKLTQLKASRASNELDRFVEATSVMMSPNIQSSDRYLTNLSFRGGQLISHRYKEIEGTRIPWTPVTANYTWVGGAEMPSGFNTASDQHGMYDQETQQKIPLFYNVKLTGKDVYLKPTQDVKKVATRSKMVAEVALTFKHRLSYAELQAKLPKGVHAAWYWLGLADAKADPTNVNNNYVGIQASTVAGKLKASDYQYFKKALTVPKKLDYSWRTDGYDIFAGAAKDAKQYPTLAKATFAGVIVTGKSAAFKSLVQADWITASSVGYFQPESVLD
ncbi:anti sigma factor C-terminal domain-containing protein [Lactiplantibacillus daowaiensis]|uniref:Anti sigma factor C-terminal domain-containing protein n=1 Tax=Lactiplantibacillus daowaiensis TaxID=2559918 RepID=A0ABW1S0A5_9LACO|nr:anti sigma factor C-terminal domain-containing protein [Lactiplantibacillus daowaiensis]